jgi:serine-type D-Ala-D-Ala carboxypeptidase/endopeptidase
VRDRIMGPLGMTDTVITLDPEQSSRLAPGTRRRGGPAGLWTIPGLAGAGALRSTVADLFTFLHAQLGLLPPDVPRGAIPGRPLTPAMRIGLGWMLLPIGRGKLDMVWHNAGTGGYRSFVGWTPATHTAAVVLSSNVRGVDQLGSRALLDLAATA